MSIERLKTLEAKATPGPWPVLSSKYYQDAEFIAEMRNALPKLLAVVEALDGNIYEDSDGTLKVREVAVIKVRDALRAMDESWRTP